MRTSVTNSFKGAIPCGAVFLFSEIIFEIAVFTKNFHGKSKSSPYVEKEVDFLYKESQFFLFSTRKSRCIMKEMQIFRYFSMNFPKIFGSELQRGDAL